MSKPWVARVFEDHKSLQQAQTIVGAELCLRLRKGERVGRRCASLLQFVGLVPRTGGVWPEGCAQPQTDLRSSSGSGTMVGQDGAGGLRAVACFGCGEPSSGRMVCSGCHVGMYCSKTCARDAARLGTHCCKQHKPDAGIGASDGDGDDDIDMSTAGQPAQDIADLGVPVETSVSSGQTQQDVHMIDASDSDDKDTVIDQSAGIDNNKHIDQSVQESAEVQSKFDEELKKYGMDKYASGGSMQDEFVGSSGPGTEDMHMDMDTPSSMPGGSGSGSDGAKVDEDLLVRREDAQMAQDLARKIYRSQRMEDLVSGRATQSATNDGDEGRELLAVDKALSDEHQVSVSSGSGTTGVAAGQTVNNMQSYDPGDYLDLAAVSVAVKLNTADLNNAQYKESVESMLNSEQTSKFVGLLVQHRAGQTAWRWNEPEKFLAWLEDHVKNVSAEDSARIDALAAFMYKHSDGLFGTFKALIESLWGAFRTAYDAAKGAASWMWQKVSSALYGQWTAPSWSTVIDKMYGAAGWLKDTTASAVGAVWSGIKGLAGGGWQLGAIIKGIIAFSLKAYDTGCRYAAVVLRETHKAVRRGCWALLGVFQRSGLAIFSAACWLGTKLWDACKLAAKRIKRWALHIVLTLGTLQESMQRFVRITAELAARGAKALLSITGMLLRTLRDAMYDALAKMAKCVSSIISESEFMPKYVGDKVKELGARIGNFFSWLWNSERVWLIIRWSTYVAIALGIAAAVVTGIPMFDAAGSLITGSASAICGAILGVSEWYAKLLIGKFTIALVGIWCVCKLIKAMAAIGVPLMATLSDSIDFAGSKIYEFLAKGCSWLGQLASKILLNIGDMRGHLRTDLHAAMTAIAGVNAANAPLPATKRFAESVEAVRSQPDQQSATQAVVTKTEFVELYLQNARAKSNEDAEPMYVDYVMGPTKAAAALAAALSEYMSNDGIGGFVRESARLISVPGGGMFVGDTLADLCPDLYRVYMPTTPEGRPGILPGAHIQLALDATAELEVLIASPGASKEPDASGSGSGSDTLPTMMVQSDSGSADRLGTTITSTGKPNIEDGLLEKSRTIDRAGLEAFVTDLAGANSTLISELYALNIPLFAARRPDEAALVEKGAATVARINRANYMLSALVTVLNRSEIAVGTAGELIGAAIVASEKPKLVSAFALITEIFKVGALQTGDAMFEEKLKGIEQKLYEVCRTVAESCNNALIDLKKALNFEPISDIDNAAVRSIAAALFGGLTVRGLAGKHGASALDRVEGQLLAGHISENKSLVTAIVAGLNMKDMPVIRALLKLIRAHVNGMTASDIQGHEAERQKIMRMRTGLVQYVDILLKYPSEMLTDCVSGIFYVPNVAANALYRAAMAYIANPSETRFFELLEEQKREGVHLAHVLPHLEELVLLVGQLARSGNVSPLNNSRIKILIYGVDTGRSVDKLYSAWNKLIFHDAGIIGISLIANVASVGLAYAVLLPQDNPSKSFVGEYNRPITDDEMKTIVTGDAGIEKSAQMVGELRHHFNLTPSDPIKLGHGFEYRAYIAETHVTGGDVTLVAKKTASNAGTFELFDKFLLRGILTTSMPQFWSRNLANKWSLLASIGIPGIALVVLGALAYHVIGQVRKIQESAADATDRNRKASQLFVLGALERVIISISEFTGITALVRIVGLDVNPMLIGALAGLITIVSSIAIGLIIPLSPHAIFRKLLFHGLTVLAGVVVQHGPVLTSIAKKFISGTASVSIESIRAAYTYMSNH